jgi:leader peptidase (prepilin peptidase)/N-methyltransferase
VAPDPVWAGALAAVVAGAGGLLVPRVIGWLPEPEPDADLDGDADRGPVPAPEADPVPDPVATEPAGARPVERDGAPPAPPKLPYAELAAYPRLAIWCALVAAAAAGVMGAGRGWEPDLAVWIYLSVMGVALGYVDWRTRLLPMRLVVPSYGVVGALLLVAFAVEQDTDQLLRSLLAWLAVFAVFFVLWFIYPRGLGYGDVRLSGLLGMALGWLGWPAVLVGIYAGFLLGAVIGGVLALLRVVDRRGYPFGPFMLFGAVLGVLTDGSDLVFWS